MGRKHQTEGREGRVVVDRTGDRWAAQLELDEREGGETSRLRVDLPGVFVTEAAAVQAGQRVLADWRAGRVTLREIVLRELAAAYRQLREKHKPMEPVAVPTTSLAWERAIALWELAAWVDADGAARYREHVLRAFGDAVAPVKRHRLPDAESDAAQ
jgi:hypothetical protein